MEDFESITDEYDKEFISLMLAIEQKSDILNKYDKLRIKNWCKKLCQVTNNVEWKKNRNWHAICILDSILNEHFEEPYNKFPPEGSVPILNKALVKSKLSKKFFEEAFKMQNEEQQQGQIDNNENISNQKFENNKSNNNIQNQNFYNFNNANKNINNINNNNKISEGNEEIINEQKKEIERLNTLLQQKDLEIGNLINEKNKMKEYIEVLEQKINSFMELDKAKQWLKLK